MTLGESVSFVQMVLACVMEIDVPLTPVWDMYCYALGISIIDQLYDIICIHVLKNIQ